MSVWQGIQAGDEDGTPTRGVATDRKVRGV
jgi:hypothetical protein